MNIKEYLAAQTKFHLPAPLAKWAVENYVQQGFIGDNDLIEESGYNSVVKIIDQCFPDAVYIIMHMDFDTGEVFWFPAGIDCNDIDDDDGSSTWEWWIQMHR